MARRLSPVATVAALRALIRHREGDTVLVKANGDTYVYDAASTATDNGESAIRPTNFATAGVWLKAAEGGEGSAQFVDVTITSAQVLALNATPIALVPAPGANKALVFEGAVIHKPAGTAYAGIAAGEDLGIKYTDGSGLEVAACEMTGFADSTGAQARYIRPRTGALAAGTVSDLAVVANAPLVAHMLVSEITTGDSDFKLRVFYRVVPTVL